jgi:hypothetical protein
MRYVAFVLLIGASTMVAADNKQTARRDSDMQRAIAFERYKDLAAARQARKEARHPSVPKISADRSADRESKDVNTVQDPRPSAKPNK